MPFKFKSDSLVSDNGAQFLVNSAFPCCESLLTGFIKDGGRYGINSREDDLRKLGIIVYSSMRYGWKDKVFVVHIRMDTNLHNNDPMNKFKINASGVEKLNSFFASGGLIVNLKKLASVEKKKLASSKKHADTANMTEDEILESMKEHVFIDIMQNGAYIYADAPSIGLYIDEKL